MFNVLLLLDNMKQALLKRSKLLNNKKDRETWLRKGYCNEPLVSVIIQSHNKSLQIAHILPVLRKYGKMEIIVIDDGSEFVHTKRLVKVLNGANEFVVRCNDLYENITYDRTIRMANGKYVALLQDDDTFDDISWINKAVKLFERYPKMAILGGKDGVDLSFEEDKNYAHGGQHTSKGDFCFVVGVNRAPMWLNRTLYMEYLGHLDVDFIPFQFDDYELCCRTWMKGLQVGWYDAGFKSLSAGGMRIWNSQFTKEQSLRNGRLLYDKYKDSIDYIRSLVKSVE